jgi:hypothetical protein
MPMSRNTWFPVSDIEWYVSESIEGLPVMSQPMNLRIAMAPFAKRAAITTDLLPAIVRASPGRRKELPTK